MLPAIKIILPYCVIALEFIAALIVAIIVHEAGHLIASKRCKCKVTIFSLGFGKPFFKKLVNGTTYQISWILLGGFCALEGEMEYSKKKYALMNLKYTQKLYIVLAGIGANCLSAIFSFGLYSMFGQDWFYMFGQLSILLGLSNLIFLLPGIDGSYPFLFLLEKVFGKKEGIKVMARAVDVGMFFINFLNLVCVVYGIYWLIDKLTHLLR
jgi:membrane-associated protease RseP (regulator of RpoE activity)